MLKIRSSYKSPLSLKATYKCSQYPISLSSTGEGLATGPETFTVADTPTMASR